MLLLTPPPIEKSCVRHLSNEMGNSLPFYIRFCNGVNENFQHHFVINTVLAIASQKLVSRIVLPYKSLQSNRDIFYDEMVLIFCMKTIAMRIVKRLAKVDYGLCHRKTLLISVTLWNFMEDFSFVFRVSCE